ncbi:DUF2846 domain-containing protein [Pendulispora rubella]|uniref:DUF2846 domain-containing protein n=1 Tax=Pendulispora rubella TaxID=2741070 RepID=A0ABZ2LAK5_9BACT
MKLFLLLAMVLFVGCSAHSDYMQAGTPPAPPTAEAATVVFIRPSGYAGGQLMTVLDANGRFLGDSLPKSYFSVKVPPGEHVFVVWGENTGALRANVVGGKTYYVEVSTKLGMMSARVHLLALTPRHENWKELPEWLKESKPLSPNEAAGQAYLAKRQEAAQERIRRAREILTEYDANELAARTILPQDGQ